MHEGFSPSAYQDSVGVWTIGYGTNLEKLVIDEKIAREWMVRELRRLAALLSGHSYWAELSQTRKEVLIEMAYNLGLAGLAKFERMRAALLVKDYDKAADEMLASKWAHQVGVRAIRLSRLMREG